MSSAEMLVDLASHLNSSTDANTKSDSKQEVLGGFLSKLSMEQNFGAKTFHETWTRC